MQDATPMCDPYGRPLWAPEVLPRISPTKRTHRSTNVETITLKQLFWAELILQVDLWTAVVFVWINKRLFELLRKVYGLS